MICSLPLLLSVASATTAMPAVPADQAALSADEIRAIASGVLADAETRSSLLSGAGVGGHDGRFFLASPDGAFRLNIGGYLQFRYLMNFGDDLAGDPDNDFESGFQINRTRLIFSGKLHDKIEFLFLPSAGTNGDWSILDAWARVAIGDSNWKFTWGQFKTPFWREWTLSERFNQAVERSEVSGVFSEVYSQGVMVETTTDNLRFYLAFSDGLRTHNTNFASPATSDYAFTTRIEFKPTGNWGQFADMTSLGNTENGFLIGAALHHQGETDNFRGADITRLTQYTVDLNYEATNWNISAAGVGRSMRANGESVDDFGVLVQAGLFIAEKCELIGRYQLLIPDSDAAGDDNFNAITVGMNHYFHGHALKLTLDATWYLDDPADTTILGFGPSNDTAMLSTTDEDQVSIRAQIQFMF